MRGKIKKKGTTTSLSAAFSKGSFKLIPAPSWVRFYESQVPWAEVSSTIFSQGLVWDRSGCAVGFSSWLCEANPLCPCAVSRQWFFISSFRRAEKSRN